MFTNANAQLLQLQSPNLSSFSRPPSTPSPSLLAGNSISNTPAASSSNNSSSKPLKCVLPPVSQEQFDKYSLINTDDLVRKVKDLLSKFSISQRLFGECILGLSQGSVSDLLARPKPWIMLTQKGREPFIRMQMFIDDPDAIKKLMANQYKTPSVKTASDSLSTTVTAPSPALSIKNENHKSSSGSINRLGSSSNMPASSLHVDTRYIITEQKF